MLRTTTFLVFLSALAPLGATQARVWVVDDDGGPGVDFTTIQAAVDAAVDGEIVLVREGVYDQAPDETYAGFTIAGKSLVVSAEPGATVVVSGPTTIRDLAPDQTVLMRGLSSVQHWWVASSCHVLDCAGAVWVEDCRFNAGTLIQEDERPSFEVRDSVSVTIVRSLTGSVLGQVPWFSIKLASPGLVATSSQVTLYDTEVIGGGYPTQGAMDQVGGTGLVLDDAVVFGSGSVLQGGAGNPGYPDTLFTSCQDGGTGGDGASLGLGARLFWLDGSLAGGPGGPAGEGFVPCGEGVGGTDVLTSGGQFTTLTGLARHLVSNSPVREGETWNVVLASEPGDLAILAMATRHLPLGFYAPWKGAILNLLPVSVSVLGVVPAEGFLGTSGTVEDVYAPGEGLPLLFQGVVLTPGGEIVLTPGTMQLQLDASL